MLTMNGKIKAVFFDIDGTLLSHKTKSVPESTKQALIKLQSKGIRTFIATGRHISEMKDLPLDDLAIDGYITLNGQYCYNRQGIIYDLPIDHQDILDLIKVIDEHPFPCIFVEKELMYINYNNDAVQIVQDAISTPLPDINDLHRGYTEKIYQVIPYDANEEKVMKIMKHCKCTKWHPLAIDVIPSAGGKQHGIEKTLEYYNIKQEETMAFGDGENDIDMFHYVALSIAMGNSNDKVKAEADDVTDDIDEDGIDHALKKYNVI